MISVREANSLVTGNDSLPVRVARILFGSRTIRNLGESDQRLVAQAQWSCRALDGDVTIFDQGEDCQNVSVLLSGWSLRQQTLPDGKRQILDFVLPGSLLGFRSSEFCTYGIETVTPCIIASLPARQFYALISRIPALAIRVAEIVSESEVRAYDYVTNLGRRSARERVAGFIAQMVDRTGTIAGASGHCSFELPITQVAIADALGLSNEHVCRTLSKLTADGRIRMQGHRVTVLDIKGLLSDACMEFRVARGLQMGSDDGLFVAA